MIYEFLGMDYESFCFSVLRFGVVVGNRVIYILNDTDGSIIWFVCLFGCLVAS